MHELIIKRSEWRRGQGPEESMLRNPETGKMCCLGFAVNQLAGIPIHQLNNRGDAKALCDYTYKGRNILEGTPLNFLLQELYPGSRNTDDAQILMNINDGPRHPQTREDEIKTIFKKYGIKVIFTD